MAAKRSRDEGHDVIDLTGDDEGGGAAAAAPVARRAAPPLRLGLEEVSGDLFTCAADVSLAHCVAEDLRLGKGIAIAFRERFGHMDDMRSQCVRVGGVASFRHERRFVYALVTKETSSRCLPTLAALRACLVELKRRMARDGVTKLAVPRLGCGLDKLAWPDVRDVMRDVFADTGAHISVYSL